jgi:hypothetical protein
MTRSTQVLKLAGAICSRCQLEFDGEHGTPVFCHACHDEIKGKGMQPTLPKAWLEEKSK